MNVSHVCSDQQMVLFRLFQLKRSEDHFLFLYRKLWEGLRKHYIPHNEETYNDLIVYYYSVIVLSFDSRALKDHFRSVSINGRQIYSNCFADDKVDSEE